MSTGPARSLRDALDAYRREQQLPSDDAARASWTCRVGPAVLRLPNFGWRRRAIEAHDLHHVLTGYPCTMCGEFQMAAWEFAAGPMPHWGASLFCLPLVVAGLLRAPRATFAAFVAGRRSRSLHGQALSNTLLSATVDEARAALAKPRAGQLADYFEFAVLILRATLVSLGSIALSVVIWIALRRL